MFEITVSGVAGFLEETVTDLGNGANVIVRKEGGQSKVTYPQNTAKQRLSR